MAIVKCLECSKDVSTEAKSCPHCGTAKFKKPDAAAGIAGIITLAFIGWLCWPSEGQNEGKSGSIPQVVSSIAPAAPDVEETPVPASRKSTAKATERKTKQRSAEVEKKFERCRSALLLASQADVFRDMDWKPPAPPKVVVGPGFFVLGFKEKSSIIETVNCFLMAGRGGAVDFSVTEYLNGDTVGNFHWGKFSMER